MPDPKQPIKATRNYLEQFTCVLCWSSGVSEHDASAMRGMWLLVSKFPKNDMIVGQDFIDVMTDYLCEHVGAIGMKAQCENMRKHVTRSVKTLENVESRINAQAMAMSLDFAAYA